jgi:hypothetical protein
MYPNLIEPFVKWTNANVEAFVRFAKSPEVAELNRTNIDAFFRVPQEYLSRLTQSGAYAEWTKANLDNFSNFTQEYVRKSYAVASEAQAELTRGIREGTRRLQEVSKLSSNIAGISADETARAVTSFAEEGEEAEEKARAARRRG